MYKKSKQLLDKALYFIPMGSQTFSKSLTQYPRGVSPFFIEKGKGVACKVIKASAKFLKKTYGIKSINLGVDINNTKAIGSYSEAGFNFEETKYVEIIDTSHVSMVLNIL